MITLFSKYSRVHHTGVQLQTNYLFQPITFLQGGDPIEFKKLNDAFNKLLGHIEKVGGKKIIPPCIQSLQHVSFPHL